MNRDALARRLRFACVGGALAWPVWLAGLGGTPLLAADAANPAFTQVTVDLEGGLAEQVLPFDEPFILTGQVPTGVQKLEVRCWELETCAERPDHPSCEGKSRSATILPDTTLEPRGSCPTWTEPFPTWVNRVDPTAATPTFNVLAPMMEAEKYYMLGFLWDRTPSPEEAATFAASVSATLDSVLWTASSGDGTLPATGSLTDADLASIRNQAITSLLRITGSDRVQDCSETEVLCPDAELSDVRDELNRLLLPVRNQQSQIAAAIEGYKSEIDALNLQLAQLRSNADVAAFATALEGAAATTPSLADEAAAVRAALGVADLDDLTAADRRTPEALAAFVAGARAKLGDASAKVGALRSLFVDADGNPKPLADELVRSGAVDEALVAELEDAAAPRGLVGSIDRALTRIGDALAAIDNELIQRRDARQRVADAFETRAQTIVLLAATSQADFVTAQRNYLSGDGGLLWAPELEDFSSYVGTNVYSRPINKAADISQFGSFWQTLDRRLSLTIGLTVDGVGDDETRDDLFSNQSLVLGVGARMTGSLRLMLGALVFKERDPNPLVDDDSVAVSPFLSMSFDVDVVPFLTGLGNVFQGASGGT
jgi:hypothetical protein